MARISKLRTKPERVVESTKRERFLLPAVSMELINDSVDDVGSLNVTIEMPGEATATGFRLEISTDFGQNHCAIDLENEAELERLAMMLSTLVPRVASLRRLFLEMEAHPASVLNDPKLEAANA